MFRTVSIIGFLAAFGGIAFHYMVFRPKAEAVPGEEKPSLLTGISKKLVFLLTLFFLEQRYNFLEAVRKLIYLLALLCFVILAVTGFYPVVVLDKTIFGYWLMFHATAGGVFAACLAVLALMWAHNCRFNQIDWPWVGRFICLIRRQPSNRQRPALGPGTGQKICFWLIVALALPLILSVVLSMFPLFGTHIQELLLQLHRYTALVAALAVIVHTYLISLAKTREITGR